MADEGGKCRIRRCVLVTSFLTDEQMCAVWIYLGVKSNTDNLSLWVFSSRKRTTRTIHSKHPFTGVLMSHGYIFLNPLYLLSCVKSKTGLWRPTWFGSDCLYTAAVCGPHRLWLLCCLFGSVQALLWRRTSVWSAQRNVYMNMYVWVRGLSTTRPVRQVTHCPTGCIIVTWLSHSSVLHSVPSQRLKS